MRVGKCTGQPHYNAIFEVHGKFGNRPCYRRNTVIMRLFTIDIYSKIVNLGAMTWPLYIENHIYSEGRRNIMRLNCIQFHGHFMIILTFSFFYLFHWCGYNGLCSHRRLLQAYIRKTCPCSLYPLKPHFYIAKLGYAGVYLFFLFLLQNIDCGYSLEPPRRGGSNVYPQSMF